MAQKHISQTVSLLLLSGFTAFVAGAFLSTAEILHVANGLRASAATEEYTSALLFSPSNDAIFRVIPKTGTYDEGEEFTVTFEMDSTQPITGIEVVATAQNLTYVSFDDTGSAYTVDVVDPNPTVNGSNLDFDFTRLIFTAGISGNNKELLKMTFKAGSEGPASITLNKSTSQAIASADTLNKLQTVENASYTVQGSGGGGGPLSFCAKFKSEHRKRKGAGHNFEQVRLVIFERMQGGGRTEIINTVLSSDTKGEVVLDNQTLLALLSDQKNYDILIKPRGHVRRAKKNVTSILTTTCHDMGIFKVGDFDQNGSVDLADLLQLMEHIKKGDGSGDTILKKIFANGAHLRDFIDTIRNYVNSESDES